MTTPAELIASLYDDLEECARVAQLQYVTSDEPGYTRIRCGRGFRYRDAKGLTVADPAIRARLAGLAIPPAWRNVWICTSENGHLLAVGEDDRGRRQYIYHERWRSLRDQLNFYRLVGFGAVLPTVRADVAAQLRRRSFDTDRVLGAMLRIIDLAGIRVGNEVYAEENESYGLSTLRKRHVMVSGSRIDFRFPAKSGRRAEITVKDAGVARVIEQLLDQRGSKWLFRVDGERIDADDINSRLAQITGAHVTAKDFRTWHGTVTAFRHLRRHLPVDEHAETHVVAAIDAASISLGNTRAVARSHYVHPDVIEGYVSGDLGRYLHKRRPRGSTLLDDDERLLLGYLANTLERRAGDLTAAA